MSKSVLCTCEDVTLDDVRHAIDKGYRDIESIKRYTGFGTGVCQGKTCLSAIARVLAERTGASPGAVLPFTPRPPLHPVEMSLLASVPVNEATPPRGGVPPVVQVGSHALRPAEPAPARTRVVIVGGGIMGLALAHNLAKLGVHGGGGAREGLPLRRGQRAQWRRRPDAVGHGDRTSSSPAAPSS